MPPLRFPYFTPDDRPWRIDWYGDVIFPGGINGRSQPNVQVAISPVRADPTSNDAMLSSRATESSIVQRFFPIGMLPYVRIGDVWQNGERKYSPDYQREQFSDLHITRASSKLIKAGQSVDEVFVLPLKQHPWHHLLTGSFCLSIELTEGRQIVIPTMELIRFYFGSSSELLHRLFMHDIKYEQLWEHQQYTIRTGRLHLKLARKLSGVSAADIGRIALSNVANRAACRIRISCQRDLLSGEKSAYPQTWFPFEGKTNLAVVGKWLPFGSKPDQTFVVYRIESCSHPFPFKTLSYEAADDGKVSKGSERQDGKSNNASPSDAHRRRAKTHKSQELSESDPGVSRTRKNFQFEANNRFPDLLCKEIWRERYETQDPPELWPAFTQENVELVSVGDPISTCNDVTSIDIIAAPMRAQLLEETKIQKFVRNGIDTKIKKERVAPDIVNVELITLPGYTHPVFSLPSLIDENGEIDPISVCEGGRGVERCRRGCFVEISAPSSKWSILVVEPKSTLCKEEVLVVENYELKRAMSILLAESKRVTTE